MKLTMLVMITFVQLMVCSAVRADVRGLASSAIAQAAPGGSQGVSRVEDGSGDKKLSINVTVGDPPSSRMWYAQPIWIAVFVLGGVVLLALLVMGLRGSGGAGATVVKV